MIMKKIIATIFGTLLFGWMFTGMSCSNNSQKEEKKDSNIVVASFDNLSLKEIMMMDSVEKKKYYLALTDSLPDLWDKKSVDATTRTLDIPIPSISADSIIFIEYRQEVSGYKVKIVFKRPYDDLDIGRAHLYFSKPGHSFVVYCDCFADRELNVDVLDKVRVGETVYLDYIAPQRDEYLSNNSPFYFKDMDFDGEDELVVNNIGMGSRGHNTYNVFKVFGVEKPLQLVGPPFYETCAITDYNVEYEPKSKCVLDKRYDGFDAYGHFRYKSIPSEDDSILKRKFILIDAEDMGHVSLKDEKASDSINLLQPYKKYKRINGKLVLIERGMYESGNYGWNNKEVMLERNEKGLKCDSTGHKMGEFIYQMVFRSNFPFLFLFQ